MNYYLIGAGVLAGLVAMYWQPIVSYAKSVTKGEDSPVHDCVCHAIDTALMFKEVGKDDVAQAIMNNLEAFTNEAE